MKLPLKTKWQAQIIRVENHHPKIQVAADRLERLISDWSKHHDPRMLILGGNTGSGKTTMAQRVLDYATSHRLEVFDSRKWPGTALPSTGMCWFPKFCARIEKGADDDESIEDLVSDFTLVDDIGAEVDKFKSGFHIPLLARVLDKLRGRWGIITTNIHHDLWASRWDIRVQDRLLRQTEYLDMFDVPSFQTL